jgi:multiple sugar transport system substrate-binding protein
MRLRALLTVCLVLWLSLGGCSWVDRSSRATDSVVHLTLWHGVNPPANREVLQTLVDRFNQQHPQIQVEALYAGQGDQQIPKILAAVVGGAPPDLLWYAPMLTGQLVELDAIVPLDELGETAQNQIDPALFEAMRFEDHLWSVPFSVNNVGIFYRPSLFAAAGITQLPQTWEQLRQAAGQLTRPDQNQHGLLLPLGKGEWTVFMWLPFFWTAGGELVDADAGLAPVVLGREPTKSAAVAALQFWQDLVQTGVAILSQPERGYELDSFVAGKVAMQLTGPWTLRQLQATGVDYGVMPIPTRQRPATSLGGENLFVFRTTPQREQAAKQFAKYVLGEEFQTAWAIATGYLPVNLQSRQSQSYRAFLQQQPVVQVFLDQAPFGHSRPIAPGYSRFSDAIGRAVEAVLLGQSPTESWEQAQRQIERSFQ